MNDAIMVGMASLWQERLPSARGNVVRAPPPSLALLLSAVVQQLASDASTLNASLVVLQVLVFC